jgi:AcrR family transcriptional regulator
VSTAPRRRRGPGRPRSPLDPQHLLAVAQAAFARSGYAGTSLSTIARQVGVSKAAVLHHFPSKQALYFAALARVVEDLGTFIAQARSDSPDPFRRLDHLGTVITRYLAAHVDATRLLVTELVLGGPFARGPGRPFIQGTLATTAAFLADGMAAGAFQRVDPRQLALSIASLHLLYFAIAEPAGELLGGDVRSPGLLRARIRALLPQVRAMCRGDGERPTR